MKRRKTIEFVNWKLFVVFCLFVLGLWTGIPFSSFLFFPTKYLCFPVLQNHVSLSGNALEFHLNLLLWGTSQLFFFLLLSLSLILHGLPGLFSVSQNSLYIEFLPLWSPGSLVSLVVPTALGQSLSWPSSGHTDPTPLSYQHKWLYGHLLSL